MAHAYTTKRGKNKISKLGVRKDHQQNSERQLKSNVPLANLQYNGPKESVFAIGHLANSRIDDRRATATAAGGASHLRGVVDPPPPPPEVVSGLTSSQCDAPPPSPPFPSSSPPSFPLATVCAFSVEQPLRPLQTPSHTCDLSEVRWSCGEERRWGWIALHQRTALVSLTPVYCSCAAWLALIVNRLVLAHR